MGVTCTFNTGTYKKNVDAEMAIDRLDLGTNCPPPPPHPSQPPIIAVSMHSKLVIPIINSFIFFQTCITEQSE